MRLPSGQTLLPFLTRLMERGPRPQGNQLKFLRTLLASIAKEEGVDFGVRNRTLVSGVKDKHLRFPTLDPVKSQSELRAAYASTNTRTGRRLADSFTGDVSSGPLRDRYVLQGEGRRTNYLNLNKEPSPTFLRDLGHVDNTSPDFWHRLALAFKRETSFSVGGSAIAPRSIAPGSKRSYGTRYPLRVTTGEILTLRNAVLKEVNVADLPQLESHFKTNPRKVLRLLDRYPRSGISTRYDSGALSNVTYPSMGLRDSDGWLDLGLGGSTTRRGFRPKSHTETSRTLADLGYRGSQDLDWYLLKSGKNPFKGPEVHALGNPGETFIEYADPYFRNRPGEQPLLQLLRRLGVVEPRNPYDIENRMEQALSRYRKRNRDNNQLVFGFDSPTPPTELTVSARRNGNPDELDALLELMGKKTPAQLDEFEGPDIDIDWGD